MMSQSRYNRCLVLVADGARADIMTDLLDSGDMPNLKEHLVDRGIFCKALSVFPSTTGPAHIPFVSGIHPGTANCPGYRWLSRTKHDSVRRSAFRHRSLNTLHGLFLGRDMDPDKSTSLYEYFDNPSAIMEPIDFCSNKHLFKTKLRRLFYVARAHYSDDWRLIDLMAAGLTVKRLKAGSDCIVTHFFGIDEYSHLYSPTDERTFGAYKTIDDAIGLIVNALKDLKKYDDTIIAVVSDHGLTDTSVHIPVVDIVKDHGFDPFYYPKLYKKERDSAVMESGNSMAQIYFKRGDRWGDNWTYDELMVDPKTSRLIKSLTNTEGMSFVVARTKNGVVFIGPRGNLKASENGNGYHIEIGDQSPLPDHPVGALMARELREKTFDHTYPDAVNQAFLLFKSERSGDILLSSEPNYDLRWQHEDPEHHGSHGSLHSEHMKVPLAISVPITDQYVQNVDIVPTILGLCGKKPTREFDGRKLSTENGHYPDPPVVADDDDPPSRKSNGKLYSILFTVGLITISLVLTGIFRDDINRFGMMLMDRYGQDRVDFVLFLLTFISSTPLMLPIWGYAMAGIAMGYQPFHLAVVMALGSASGSAVTFLLGRYFGQTAFVSKRFPNLSKHPWTEGRSRTMVTAFLFFGTVSPIPCDILYAAAGLKRYPVIPFVVAMVVARFIRYLYLGYGFEFFGDMI